MRIAETMGLHRSTRPHVRLDYGVSGIAWREVGNRRTILARNPSEPGMLATRTIIKRTLDAIRDGGRPPATAEDGRDVLEVIAACYHSARTGQRVALGGPDTVLLDSMRMGAVPA
jgi:predicted dehydrogenase